MTSEMRPSTGLDANNATDLAQIRAQLDSMQNVLVSLHGVGGNSRLAYLLERQIRGIGGDALDQLQEDEENRGSGGVLRKKNRFVNSLIRASRRQLLSQFSSALRRSIVRDL